MDSKVTAATVHATVLNALSGVLAQGILAYRRGTMNGIDVSSILRPIVYTALTTTPNYRWQEFLERMFPTTTEPRHKSVDDTSNKSPNAMTGTGGKLKMAYTAAKFILDPALGDFWPMLLASYRVWPIVCLLNLVVVPFD
ncbi:hypothetical protein V8C26DRAFT_426938 [Trichoderma gracile]